MFKLLTEEWKLNDNLALVVISLYGGHIWDCYQALTRLMKMKERFYLFDANLSAKNAKCFKEKIKKEDMICTLQILAESGYFRRQSGPHR
jgi:hypothetical protein